jgi:single-stranded-DNA-specific exonuclease
MPDPDLVVLAGGSVKVARVLQNRGVSDPVAIGRLLNPLAEAEPDLTEYPPLQEAAAIIHQAVKAGEGIALYGDYDVDGITATAVLLTALKRLGAKCFWHIPHRFNEGYGMHKTPLLRLAQQGVKLIITADCGISNHEEISYARSLGLRVVVTDHHTPPAALPQADAIVNLKLLPPEHPSRDLPGVGTAFVLSRILLAGEGKCADDLLDLVALGVVADVVPLLGHNRQLLKKGLPLLKEKPRLGIGALYGAAKLDPAGIDEETLAFQIVPRLNAAGRLEDGGLSVRLLLADNPLEATQLASTLNSLNHQRKELTRWIQEEVIAEEGKPIVAFRPHWHQGVVGIAAGHLAQKHRVPVLLMTMARDGQRVVGSARSLPGVHLYQALERCQDKLLKFGGHPAAAGFSLDPGQLAEFQAAILAVLTEMLKGASTRTVAVDLVLKPREVSLETVNELALLAPFGEANPRPLCYSHELTVKTLRQLKSGWMLTLGDRWNSFSAALWGTDNLPEEGSTIGGLYTLSEYRSQGREPEVQVNLLLWWANDMKPLVRTEKPILTDRRGVIVTQAELAREYPGAAFFREGVNWQRANGGGRDALQPADTLVLLTPPAAPDILRQVLARVSPKQVVLVCSQEQLEGKTLINSLAGLVKYSINHLGGKAGLSHAAAVLGITEMALIAGLDVLREMKLIDYYSQRGELFFESTGLKTQEPRLTLSAWKKNLEEIKYFQEWLLRSSLTDIAELQA